MRVTKRLMAALLACLMLLSLLPVPAYAADDGASPCWPWPRTAMSSSRSISAIMTATR